MKTFFNLLGPLLNPAKVNKQISGVYSLEAFQLYEGFFAGSGKQYGIVYAEDGYDEISLTSAFRLTTPAGASIYNPGDIGCEVVAQSELFGGSTAEASANMLYKILQREGTVAQTQAVLANAGAALWVAEKAENFNDAYLMAKESLESGRAFQVFKKFIMD